MIAIGADALAPGRHNDNGPVHAQHLLKSAVGVVPVGAGLPDLEAVGEGFTRFNARETDARHAVHLKRQNQAVPVNRGILGKAVGDPQGDGVAFPPDQGGGRNGAVDGDRHPRIACEIDWRLVNDQVELGAAEHWRLIACTGHFSGESLADTGKPRQTQQYTPCGKALDEASTAKICDARRWKFFHSHGAGSCCNVACPCRTAKC